MLVSESMIRMWLSLQRQFIGGFQLAYVNLHGPGVHQNNLSVSFPDNSNFSEELELAARLVQRSGAPVTGMAKSKGKAATVMRVAYPLTLGGHASGAIVVEIDAPIERNSAVLKLLKWGEGWLNFALLQNNTEQWEQSYKPVIDRIRAQNDYNDVLVLILTALVKSTGSTRVSLGRLSPKRFQLEAISDVCTPDNKSTRVKLIQGAMLESINMGEPSLWLRGTAEIESLSKHRKLGESTDLSAVYTVPMLSEINDTTVYCFEFFKELINPQKKLELCNESVSVYSPLLELHRVCNVSWGGQFYLVIAAGLHELKAKFRSGLFIGKVALILLVVVFLIDKSDFRVSAPATLEGAVQLSVVAPFDGYIVSAHSNAGSVVVENDLLVKLDDRELVNEQRALEAEEKEISDEHRHAVATLNRGKAGIVEAQLDQIKARLALVEGQIERTVLRAPIGGLVISGDWSRSLGMPVRQGDILFEIAPLDKYKVTLRISDNDIAEVRVGMEGYVVLSATPETEIAFTVTRISAFSGSELSVPEFRVEADIDVAVDNLRPGMQGIAKVRIGKRRRIWIWTHALTDWLRLQYWKFKP
ncbi:MAG: efflux RND transporter periplasmic adaptor subunit [Granulosicoccus sp.]